VVIRSICRTATVFLVLIFVVPAWSATPPNTEVGDVIIRPLDVKIFANSPYYIGHTGIMGNWQGEDSDDPDDYAEYDLQFTGFTTTTTFPFVRAHARIQERTFKTFITVNSITGQAYENYGGGWVWANGPVSPNGPPMSPSRRQTIVNNANAFVTGDTDITYWFFPFTNDGPPTNAYRCDGWVEYILESANVGDGDGLWKALLERFIPGPVTYATIGGSREYGNAPSMTVTTTGGGSVTNGAAISSTTIYVAATEESTGSGLMKIVLTGPSGTSRDVSGLTANETFSSLSDGEYSVTVYDNAGNHPSTLGFTIGFKHFLDERLV